MHSLKKYIGKVKAVQLSLCLIVSGGQSVCACACDSTAIICGKSRSIEIYIYIYINIIHI